MLQKQVAAANALATVGLGEAERAGAKASGGLVQKRCAAGHIAVGELQGHSSHLGLKSVINLSLVEGVSSDLAAASTLLLADVLSTAER